MFIRHLVAHIWAKLDFQNLMAAMLDFVDLMHITGQRKNDKKPFDGKPKFITPPGSRGHFDPTNIMVHFVSFKQSSVCQPVSYTHLTLPTILRV